MARVCGYVFNLALAFFLGGMAMFTFVVTPVIFKSFGRDEASGIVSALFGCYFSLNMGLSALMLLLFLSCPSLREGRRRGVLLAFILLAVIGNVGAVFFLHPAIVDAKAQVASFETTPADAPERARFSRLHALSAALNLILIADGMAMVYVLMPNRSEKRKRSNSPPPAQA